MEKTTTAGVVTPETVVTTTGVVTTETGHNNSQCYNY